MVGSDRREGRSDAGPARWRCSRPRREGSTTTTVRPGAPSDRAVLLRTTLILNRRSLKNLDVQTRFRAHIAAKLVKFHADFPERTPAGVPILSTPKRREELSIILLDFRACRFARLACSR